MNDNDIIKPGTILHEIYEVKKHLASGGFGITYEAVNTMFDETVAIKEFFMADIAQKDENGNVFVPLNDNQALFDSQKEKFKKEAKRIWKLSNPHIVRVHEIFRANNTLYYVMDYIEGESLETKMANLGRPLSEDDVKALLPQVLDALETIHNDGLWHLDIKPDNLMMGNDGILRLIDFGASKQDMALGGSTMASAVAYTELFAPIEQVEQNVKYFGPWTDFYALGATLLYLLTNNKPPKHSDILDDHTPDKHETIQIPETVSDVTRKLILWMMQISPSERPQSVEEIRKFLSDHGDVTEQKLRNPLIILGSGRYLPQVIKDLLNNMVYVEGGTFKMGATPEQGNDVYNDEKPVHNITLDPFFIGRYEVTQEEWEAVMGSNPSTFRGAKRPVEQVSWDDCQSFIEKLNDMTGQKFRLPTEAEWEYAARGGNKSRNFKYAGANDIGTVAWYRGNTYDKGKSNPSYGTHNVGTKCSNELGLYDMSGNVWEWCADRYGMDYYQTSTQNNPQGTSKGSDRVRRGGCWSNGAGYCRVSLRNSGTLSKHLDDLIGLRLAL